MERQEIEAIERVEASLSEIKAELGVDKLVMMGGSDTVKKGEAIGTFGLAGCIAGFIADETRVRCFHYAPYSIAQLVGLCSFISKSTQKVYCLAQQELRKRADGKYVRVANEPESLSAFFKKLKEYNVPYEMVPYEHHSTAKMDHAGKLEVQSELHMSLELRIR